MTSDPRVSIIVPLYNDEDYVRAALDSCLSQSLRDIEVLCVDDASTDSTAAIVLEYSTRDPRVRLIRQPVNLSAFQARRAGIAAARAPYVLFLDGDDELAPQAAKVALDRAEVTGADVVGFGVQIVAAKEGFPVRFETALQPRHAELSAPNIVPSLFPKGEVANGHLWRYLFSTSILRAAYENVDDRLTFYRANDLPITFLAIAHARLYVSTAERLYRYHFRRGTSGHAIDDVEHFKFLLSGVEPISSIADSVAAAAEGSGDPQAITDSYESARLHIIGNILRYCMRDTTGELQRACLSLLRQRVGASDTIRAAAAFCDEALDALSAGTASPSDAIAESRRVLLTTAHLDTGGLQSVLLEQASQLASAGYTVTIAVMRSTARHVELPAGVTLVQVQDGSLRERLDHWQSICRNHEIDVIIDHHILYNDRWPWFVLAALAVDVPTIGWIHNFALRPIFDNNQRISFLVEHGRLLRKLVTLSPTDVAFWKLLGLEHVVYLPNPMSEMAAKAVRLGTARSAPTDRIELAWWGRLDRSTKQLDHLIKVAHELDARGVDFKLSIVGPDSRALSAAQLRREAHAVGVGERVELVGEKSADELLALLARADVLVSTSAIEGFQLTIIEAQALGMPVVMYDLPWLRTVQGNAGVVTTTPNDPVALAEAIADIAKDHLRYQALSLASLDFARAIVSKNENASVVELVSGRLSDDYAPEPSAASSRILVQWLVRYAERNIRAERRGKRGVVSEVQRLQHENDRLKRKLREAKGEIEHISSGPSFRIGRILTLIPRKLRDIMPGSRSRSQRGSQ